MKSKKLVYLEKLLSFMAKLVIKKYQPKVVAITGSVGKTTTKEMIYTLLDKFFETRKNIKNYNNEIGVPLTIIGAYSGGSSFFKWGLVFLKWLGLMIWPCKYPQVLVLEMGADRPGDIKYLCDFVPIDVGVLTSVGISHLEYFKTKREVAKEKSQLLKSIPSGGMAIVNADDAECVRVSKSLKANVIGYGFSDDSQMRASDLLYGYQSFATAEGGMVQLLKGVSFKLNYLGKIIPVRLNYCIGKPQVYSSLAAFSVAIAFNINLVDAAQSLEDFHPYPGRMSLVDGIKHTMIIDDTYNSAPDSVKAALETVRNISASRKIVALADMLELGQESVSSHTQIGKLVAESGVDLFVSVGSRMHAAAMEYAKLTERPDLVVEFDNPVEAGGFIQDVLKEGDLILVKGSQGMRMEKLVEEIMAEPSKKTELLVRQDKSWLEKEYQQP